MRSSIRADLVPILGGLAFLTLIVCARPAVLRAQAPAEGTSQADVAAPTSNRGRTTRAPHVGTERDTAGPHVFAGLGHQGFRLESADARQSLHIQGLFSVRGNANIP